MNHEAEFDCVASGYDKRIPVELGGENFVDLLSRDDGNALFGGNAFYFVTATYPDEPHIVEAQRGYAGTIA